MGRDWDQIRRVLGAALAALPALVSPVLAEDGRDAAFGALVLRWDAKVWSVVERGEGFEATCLARSCKGRIVSGTVEPGGDCAPPTIRDKEEPKETPFESGPLLWRVATWWLGCRNAHPKSVAACTIHEGRVYRVSAPLATCRTGTGYGAEAEIMSLVGAMSPRRAAIP